MKPITDYSTITEWKSDADKESYTTGTQVCWGISSTMKKYNLTFAQAYEQLMASGKLFLAGKTYIIDVRTTHS